MNFISAIISLFAGIFSFFGRITDYMKERRLRNEGKKELQGEISAKEAEILRKQVEILIRDDDIEKTIEDLKQGKF